MPTVRDLCLERVKILWPGSKNSKNSETSAQYIKAGLYPGEFKVTV